MPSINRLVVFLLAVSLLAASSAFADVTIEFREVSTSASAGAGWAPVEQQSFDSDDHDYAPIFHGAAANCMYSWPDGAAASSSSFANQVSELSFVGNALVGYFGTASVGALASFSSPQPMEEGATSYSTAGTSFSFLVTDGPVHCSLDLSLNGNAGFYFYNGGTQIHWIQDAGTYAFEHDLEPGYYSVSYSMTAAAAADYNNQNDDVNSDLSFTMALDPPTAGPFVVNITDDLPDADLGDGSADVDPMTPGDQCSLRAALEEANATPEADTIVFDLPAAPAVLLSVTSALPTITAPIVIDASTQPGVRIVLDGSALAGGQSGLVIATGPSIVHGLVVQRFPGAGIELIGGGGHVIENCRIGVDYTGTTSDPDATPGSGDELGNLGPGILINDSADNLIGDPAGQLGNVIGGNGSAGIAVFGPGSTGTEIHGNAIGAGTGGTVNASLANQDGGVLFDQGAADGRIGDLSATARNWIHDGIRIPDAVRITVGENELRVPAIWLADGDLHLPVDLGEPGPSCNCWADPPADPGANGGMPAPRIRRITATTVEGMTRPLAMVIAYRADAAGTGRGRYLPRDLTPLGNAQADADGAFIVAVDSPGSLIAVSATDLDGNTSELTQTGRPVVFAPGIGGSWLEGQNGDNLWIPADAFTDQTRNNRLERMQMAADGGPVEPVTVDGVIELAGFFAYGPLLAHLQDAGWAGNATNANSALLDLWRFANDWRQSPALLANQLGDLVTILTAGGGGTGQVAASCEVDIVAHSNGGVIAATYLKQQPAAARDRVNRLVTIGTPYLGTPQAFAAMTSGYIFELEKESLFFSFDVAWGRMLAMTRNVPGAYALAPSARYWQTAKNNLDFILVGLDGTQLHSHAETVAFLTAAKLDAQGNPAGLFRNGAIWQQQEAIHALIDDWTGYAQPPFIHRQVGRRHASTTVAMTFGGSDLASSPTSEIRREVGDTDTHLAYRNRLIPILGWGDGTVALTSATLGHDPQTGIQDFSGVDSPWIEEFESYDCTHMGLVDPACPSVDRLVQILRENLRSPATMQPEVVARLVPDLREIFYVEGDAPIAVSVLDGLGNRTGPPVPAEYNRIEYGIADLNYFPVANGCVLSLPADGDFTLEVVAAVASTQVRLSRLRGDGTGDQANALFDRQQLATGGRMRFELAAAGTPITAPVAIDANADETFEASVPPAVIVDSPYPAPAIPAPQPTTITVALAPEDSLTVDVGFGAVGGPVWDWQLTEDSAFLEAEVESGSTDQVCRLRLSSVGLEADHYSAAVGLSVTLQGLTVAYSINVNLTVTTATSVVDDPDVTTPRLFTVAAPYPNPFNPRTTISFDLPATAFTTVEVYDVQGRRVAQLLAQVMDRGRWSIDWNGMDDTGHMAPSGIYFCRVQAGGVEATHKMTMLK